MSFLDRFSTANQHVGLLAEFADPGALYHAVKAARKQGYTRLDTYSPFPIHGMDGAMGLKPSKLGYLVIIGSITGLSLAILMQWWMSAQDYAINISNKPLFAMEWAVPISFELTVLFSALFTVGGMLALNGLPRPYSPLFFSERFRGATDDRFFLHVDRRDGKYDEAATADALFALGATHVEAVGHDGARLIGRGGQPAPEPVLAPRA